MITIRGFLMCFLMWCLDITVVYALLYASFLVISCMIIPNYSLTPLWIYAYFIGIFLAGLQGQTWFALMFLTMFSLMFLCYMESALPV